MLARVLGLVLMVMGVLFFLNPQRLKNRLAKRTRRRIRWYVFTLALAVGLMLISAAWLYEGMLPKILVILGVVAIFKALYFVRCRSSDRVVEWLLNQPGFYFRVVAVVEIVLGLLLIFGLNRGR